MSDNWNEEPDETIRSFSVGEEGDSSADSNEELSGILSEFGAGGTYEDAEPMKAEDPDELGSFVPEGNTAQAEPEGDAPAEELPEEDEEPSDEEPEEPAAQKKQKKERKPRKKPIWLFILLGVIAVIAVVFFILYHNVHAVYHAELGEGVPNANLLMKDGSSANYSTEPAISLTDEGEYFAVIQTDAGKRLVFIVVRDTTAPTAEDANVLITLEDHIGPREAVRNISDASTYLIRWKTEPAFGVAGEYVAEVELTDAYSNVSVIPVHVTISGLVDVLEYEVGSARPIASDFLSSPNHQAEFVTDMDTITWDTLGDYTVDMLLDGEPYSCILRIVDTTAPVFTCKEGFISKNDIPDPSLFIESAADFTDLTYTWKETPVVSSSDTVSAVIVATDEAGNSSEQEVTLEVCDYVLYMEASQQPVTHEQLYTKLGISVSDENPEEEAFTPNFIGSEKVTVTNERGNLLLGLVVSDTVAPEGDPVAVEGYTLYELEPDLFVENIEDGTAVTVSFENAPDWNYEGKQNVTVVLTDEAGNTKRVNTSVTLQPDTEPPEIYAVRDCYCYQGEAVSYFKAVMAADNADPEPEFTVDSQVDIHTLGEYPVTYIATDKAGNRTEQTVTFTVIEGSDISDDELDEMANEILDEILTPDMTITEQLRAVFDYTHSHIRYTGVSDKTDWKKEAYSGITTGLGDCFTYFSVSYLLLSKLDCQVLRIERINGVTQHFWCLVNVGTGWYHFDTTNAGPGAHVTLFMVTTNYLYSFDGGDAYWCFDPAMYPEIATTDYVPPEDM